jgi:hypothetical protein
VAFESWNVYLPFLNAMQSSYISAMHTSLLSFDIAVIIPGCHVPVSPVVIIEYGCSNYTSTARVAHQSIRHYLCLFSEWYVRVGSLWVHRPRPFKTGLPFLWRFIVSEHPLPPIQKNRGTNTICGYHKPDIFRPLSIVCVNRASGSWKWLCQCICWFIPNVWMSTRSTVWPARR